MVAHSPGSAYQTSPTLALFFLSLGAISDVSAQATRAALIMLCQHGVSYFVPFQKKGKKEAKEKNVDRKC